MESTTLQFVDNTLSRLDITLKSQPANSLPENSLELMGPEAYFAKYGKHHLTGYAEAYTLASGGRDMLLNQDDYRGKLAGALIRWHLTNEELTEIAGEN